MSDFVQLLALARTDDGARKLVIPETWHQGRTAYGGFSSALALSEAMKVGGDLPPLRSAQIAMMAPLAGEVAVAARIVRQGRNATWMVAEVSGEKGLAVAANFVFMRPVASALAINERPVPGGLIPADDARAFINDHAPAFLRNHFDVRFALPRSERRQAELCWWVRPRDYEALDPTVALILTGDALPPGVMPLLGARVPVSTMHWQVNLLSAAPQTSDGWWLLRSTSDYAQDGCSSQQMSAWNSQGGAVMAGTQSIALFG
jgi:hypothetical protein